MTNIQKYLKNSMFTAIAGATLFFSSCKIPELPEAYECRRNGLEITITEGTHSQMNIGKKVGEDIENKIYAVDLDGDGHFNQITKVENEIMDEQMQKLANYKSLDSLYKIVVHEKNYPKTFEYWAPKFSTPIDTLIDGFTGKYGICDISKNGSYDIIECIGASPNSYFLILREGFEKEITNTYSGTLSIKLGSHTTTVDSASFQKSLDGILNN